MSYEDLSYVPFEVDVFKLHLEQLRKEFNAEMNSFHNIRELRRQILSSMEDEALSNLTLLFPTEESK